MEQNDEITGTHIDRVSRLAEHLAKLSGQNKTMVEKIGLYAPLHDIGKVGVSDSILNKPDKLTKEEFETMKKHTQIGYELVRGFSFGEVAKNIVRYHHEKWDGTGYGTGIKGKEIPIEARIVAIVDVYDALRSERLYKDAYTHKESMKIIKEGKGNHFDPELVDLFITHQREFRKLRDVDPKRYKKI